jgi:hypothetical protein
MPTEAALTSPQTKGTRMNRLFLNRVYLAGPIDLAKDFGVGWRQAVQEELRDLDLIFLDPCYKPMFPGFDVPDLENHARRQELKERGDWETLAREMRQIRSIDLRMSDQADFIIAHIDLNVYSTGTFEEIACCNRRKVPILLHVEQGLKRTPDWLRGELPWQHIFDSWDAMYTYIRHIASEAGQIDTLGRWRFFNYAGMLGMDKIELPKGKISRISPEDWRFLFQLDWKLERRGKSYHAVTDSGHAMIRLVAKRMGVSSKSDLNHANGDTLDCRRENIEAV